jgi:Protein of unknown function (DUF5818)
MKKTPVVSLLLSVIALTTALLIVLTVAVFLTSRPVLAQSGSNSAPNTSTQSQPIQAQPTQLQPAMPPDQNAQATPASADKPSFIGKIVKSGGKLVLADAASNTTYQLDDQKKAHEFLNQSVRVTGVLDAATGTIRVSTIGPA